MPTRIIQKPDYIGDAITGILERAREKERADEERHRQEEARLKRARLTGFGALAGAGVGLLAAPALGLAGTAAGSGMFAGVPATAGALGSGGSLSGLGALSVGLTGATLGSQVGGAIDSGDFTPALASAANVTQGILADQENRRTFGYNSTPAERAAFAREAIDHGADFGSMVNVARNGGTSVSRQLSIMRAAQSSDSALQAQLNDANIRMEPGAFRAAAASLPGGSTELFQQIATQQNQQRSEAAYQDRLQSNFADLDSELLQMGQKYGWEPVPDEQGVRSVQEDLGPIKSDLDLYERTNGREGASLEELQGGITALRGRLNNAAGQSGVRMRPKSVTAPLFNAQGQQIGERPPGLHVDDDGTVTAIETDEKGNLHYKWNKREASKPMKVIQSDGSVQEIDADFAPIPRELGGGLITRSGVNYHEPRADNKAADKAVKEIEETQDRIRSRTHELMKSAGKDPEGGALPGLSLEEATVRAMDEDVELSRKLSPENVLRDKRIASMPSGDFEDLPNVSVEMKQAFEEMQGIKKQYPDPANIPPDVAARYRLLREIVNR